MIRSIYLLCSDNIENDNGWNTSILHQSKECHVNRNGFLNKENSPDRRVSPLACIRIFTCSFLFFSFPFFFFTCPAVQHKTQYLEKTLQWKGRSVCADNVRSFELSQLQTALVLEKQDYIHGRSGDCKPLVGRGNVVPLKKGENVDGPGCRRSTNGERRRANR